MIVKTYRYIVVLLFTLFMGSCEYYIGLNQQPEFTSDSIPEGLNIIGILRPDTLGFSNRSFVFVQQLYPISEFASYEILTDAQVRIERLEEGRVAESFNFPLMNPDDYFEDTLYRAGVKFRPQAAEEYRIRCNYQGMEEAIGRTTMPSVPNIKEGSLYADEGEISFTLLPDSFTHMIDVYISGENTGTSVSRFQMDNNELEVSFMLPGESPTWQIKIYAYDENLSLYWGSSNSFVNFNKYRSTISTLESGYGVFGSMNFTVISVPLTD